MFIVHRFRRKKYSPYFFGLPLKSEVFSVYNKKNVEIKKFLRFRKIFYF